MSIIPAAPESGQICAPDDALVLRLGPPGLRPAEHGGLKGGGLGIDSDRLRAQAGAYWWRKVLCVQFLILAVVEWG